MGAQLILISFATTRLHGICNGRINRMEDGGGGGGGGAHSSPTALGLGISAPPPTPNFRVFCLGLGGGTKVFVPHDQTTGDLTFTSPGHTHSPVLYVSRFIVTISYFA